MRIVLLPLLAAVFCCLPPLHAGAPPSLVKASPEPLENSVELKDATIRTGAVAPAERRRLEGRVKDVLLAARKDPAFPKSASAVLVALVLTPEGRFSELRLDEAEGVPPREQAALAKVLASHAEMLKQEKVQVKGPTELGMLWTVR